MSVSPSESPLLEAESLPVAESVVAPPVVAAAVTGDSTDGRTATATAVLSANSPAARGSAEPFDPFSISRPDVRLRNYYLLLGLISGMIPALPLLTKFLTLQYRFDDSGISMKWGLIFRNEIHLTYRRIQDIHLTRNLLQRWFGLATVSLQTASGSSAPEMKIEGILQADELRDFLYSRMRGAKSPAAEGATDANGAAVDQAEVTTMLRDIRDALQRIARGEPPVSIGDESATAVVPPSEHDGNGAMADPSFDSTANRDVDRNVDRNVAESER
ncbi:MAG TPA: PH domain-containing protein [Pirellulaceae bacterium]|nr:PH domain-containing protein [Pirellulaceae bacterium]